MKFTVLGSGSSGNAVLISSEKTNVLVDAGLSAREILRRLFEVGVEGLDGILLTHEHSDHAAGLRVLQSSPMGPISSTVVDFRLGRLLGVAYVATFGNYERQEIVARLGHALERKIVRVVLEVP